MKVFFHPHQILHHPRSYLSRGKLRPPQEVPDRAIHLLAAVRSLGFDVTEPEDYGREPLESVHSPEYLAFLESAHREWKAVGEDWGEEVMSNIYVREPNPLRGILAKAARYLADGSCPVSAETWTSAYWSAQSAVAAAEDVANGARYSYGLCRPPGHHARREAAGGFSYLNSPAIAAQHLLKQYGKIAILDVDVHHGQGVQEIFYDCADVLYVSVHSDPTNFYPVVAGHADEVGRGAGHGFNQNYPLRHGASEEEFFHTVDVALARVKGFAASVIVVAMGFDIYLHDPIGKASVTTDGMKRLGSKLESVGLPLVILQEGGYHLKSLEKNARAFFEGIVGIT